MRVCGLGDNTVDEYVLQRVGFPGGNSVNVAVTARSLGAEAAYLGVVGSDERGAFLLAQLGEHGVDVSRARVVDGPNAWCEIALDDGNRRFVSFQPEPEPLSLTADDLAYLRTFDLVHCGYAARLAFDPADLAASTRLSYDFGERPESVEPELISVLEAASFSRATLTDDEVIDLVRETQAAGPVLVIVTRGTRGAVVGHAGQLHVQPAVPAKVVDTLGAGDAFIATMLVSLFDGLPLARAAERAAAVAAAACERFGAFGTGRPLALKGTAA